MEKISQLAEMLRGGTLSLCGGDITIAYSTSNESSDAFDALLDLAAADRLESLQSSNDEGVEDRVTRIISVAAIIRRVDGNNTMGAGELAEAIVDALSTKPEAAKPRYIGTIGHVDHGKTSLTAAIASLATQPPTPASGEHMEVVAYKGQSGSLYLPHHGDPKEDAALVTLDAAQKAIAEARAEVLRAWDVCDKRRRQAETAEALNTTLSEALKMAKAGISAAFMEEGKKRFKLLNEARHTINTALAAMPAKQGGYGDEA